RADVAPEAADARRALARTGPADREGDLRHDRDDQSGRHHGPAGRAEHAPGARALAPRLRAGERPRGAGRHRRRATRQRARQARVSRDVTHSREIERAPWNTVNTSTTSR